MSRQIELCNLGSVNLVQYYKLDESKRKELTFNIVRALDKTIDNNLAYKEIDSNPGGRYIGVGINNLAALLALQHLYIDSQEALEFIDALMDDLSFNVYSASLKLAKEKGPAPKFFTSKWSLGLTPVDMSRMNFPEVWNITEYGKSFSDPSSGRLEKWQLLGNEIRTYGIRNLQCMAIAPTARSGKIIDATEGREPVFALSYQDENDASYKTKAPFFNECKLWYVPAFDCDQRALIRNAAVCQKYIDQAQSITIYSNSKSMKEISDLHIYAHSLGIKTLYYYKVQKQDIEDDDCQACTV